MLGVCGLVSLWESFGWYVRVVWLRVGSGVVYSWAWVALRLVVIEFDLRLVWGTARAGMVFMYGLVGVLLGAVCLPFERGLLVYV